MPWQEVSTVSLRAEFVALANQDRANVRALCRQFQISPPTAYKWLARFARDGPAGLVNRSRRPHHSPTRTSAEVEANVIALRDVHPTWGGRKLSARLEHRGQVAPQPSTVTEILRRHGRLESAERVPHAWRRFERPVPNQLWQMDFKGHVALAQGHGRVHPLTVLDDHSRYAIGLEACADERGATIQVRLRELFRRYGLPDQMLMDNGGAWGRTSAMQAYTPFSVWLLRLGIRVSHGRPYHPQTQGKDERFHRTLKAEVLQGPPFDSLARAQQVFDDWRTSYNLERPHEACGLQPPISRYWPSQRSFPEVLPPIEYSSDDQVRRVQKQGDISFLGRHFQVGLPFRGQLVAVRPTSIDGVHEVYFVCQRLRQIDLRLPPSVVETEDECVNHVPAHP
jgi:transposase InsO family protein